MAKFTQSQIEALAAALGDTNVGLTGREISYLLSVATLNDPGEGLAKRYRLHNAFADSQNGRGDRGAILKFLRQSMKPERYLREPDRFEPLRAKVNAALLFAGLAFNEAGVLQSADTVVTLSDAERRARELRADMELRGVHDDVLRFCRSELLVDNYFHAALEAVKSIGDKLRARTGLQDDGAALVDRVLGGEKPILAINPLTTKSERDEQKGFANLLKGVFGMFRNPTAHEAKINWEMSRADAEDLLTLASLIHRRIDLAHMPSRV